MPLPENLTEHPSPAQAYELGVEYAALLRGIFSHPRFKYDGTPTATLYKVSAETHPALFWVSDFVQKTYVESVLPFLPKGATRKCKALGNPWAYADPNHQWEWTWDQQAEALKDADGQ